jgi:DHA1 family bicyclomycin/chloramphenicol resistance-like MFS transporter
MHLMPQKNKNLIFWAANFLALLGWISVNIYLPSIPALTHYFSTSSDNLKLSISLFLLGFSLSQFFWGSYSERVGRKKSILWGLLVAECGTLIALCAPDVSVFNIGRLIEGIGIGAASVLTRALLTDAFDKVELTRAFSYISTTANIMPALAPILGGYLLIWFDWHAIFVFLLIYTSGLICLFFTSINETHPAIQPDFSLTAALKQYMLVFTHREFLGYLLPYALLSGGMIGYYAATPFIFIDHLHVPAEHYAFLSLATVFSYIIGANLARRLASRWGFNRALMLGIAMALLAGLILLVCWVFSTLSINTVVLPIMLYTFAAGIVSPNANASALMALKHMAGASSAVIGVGVYAASAILAAIITQLNLASLAALAGYISSIAIIALAGFYLLICHRVGRKS